MPDFVGTIQVSEATGATLRQLQWWRERNVLVPQFQKNNWVYTKLQVRHARLLMRFKSVWRPHRPQVSRIRVTSTQLEYRYLLFSPAPRLLLATDDQREAVRVAAGVDCGVILVDLGAYQSKVMAATGGV
jgi:MerR HTH family regulatory protein